MKKIFILFTIIFTTLFAYKSNIKGIYAVGIFDAQGRGENIQHTRKTKNDYNGTCYTKIFLYGNAFNVKPEVSIGNSIGSYINSKPIYDKRNIKIGEELTYKHLNVQNGLLKVTLRNRIFDSKVYVK
ncbi:hypothetical protein [Arcobacter arenosus]|jgi:hypothetical protein|uniref:hypothetical protein n=1 Tax=Arcobacter arenosus TaxID=2576037 RepID=UPI003BAB2557